jgi:hypothetical protein
LVESTPHGVAREHASITLDGELSWVRLITHACCNSAYVIGDHIVHTSSCGGKVTLLACDGRVLASRQVPHALDTIPDGRNGLCVRVVDGICGLDESLEPTHPVKVRRFDPADG